MSLPGQLNEAYNNQINLELASAYTYLAMMSWCEGRNFAGFARWLRAQAHEETQHALKFFDFVLDRGGAVSLQDVAAPTADYATVLEVFRAALEHEERVTAAIGDLYAKASAEQDYASLPLLNWFVTEQVEEEASVHRIVAELERVGDDLAALTLLDRDVGERRATAAQ